MIGRWITMWIDALARNEELAHIVLRVGLIILLAMALFAVPDREVANGMQVR